MREVACPNCAALVPFTGAFEFVFCPRCRTMIHLSRAQRRAAADGESTLLPPARAIRIEAPPSAPPARITSRLARLATAAGVAMGVFLLANVVATLAFATPLAVAFAHDHPDAQLPLYVVFPVPIAVAGLGGDAAAAWHLVLAATILASVAVFLREHFAGAWRRTLDVLEGGPAPNLSDPNGLFVLTRLYTASLFFSLAVAILALELGYAPRVPDALTQADAGALALSLAHASVWEELAVRVLLLGFPLLLVHTWGRGRLEQPAARYVLGKGFTLDGPALVLLVFQAVLFGVAHIEAWDVWKFPSTVVAGLAFGYLFLRYGLAACIVLHFLNDYQTVSFVLVTSEAYASLLVVAVYFLVGVGIVNFTRYLFVAREIIREGGVPEYLGGPRPPSAPPGKAEAPAGATPAPDGSPGPKDPP